jgi:dienelactone hydrolase
MFDYDHRAPLQVAEVGVAREAEAIVREITYESPLGGRVPAFLVAPEEGAGPFAGLLYLHPGQGDRSTFLPEAVALAGAGVVSLLIDAPYLRPEYAQRQPVHHPSAEGERNLYRQIVVDLRRGVDLLYLQPEVDPARIGYVGHSLGATWGGPLAGVEPRIRAFVLMAGFASLTDWYRTGTHPLAQRFRARFETPAQMASYLSELEPLVGERHIGRAASSAFLFQYAREDIFIDRDQAERYVAAAPPAKEVRWYDADHLFTGCPEARLDRVRWLADQLGFGPLSNLVTSRLAGLG